MNPIVIKLGGSVLVDANLRAKLVTQIAGLRKAKFEVVIVHGGGKQIGAMLEKLGVESSFHDGLRITDERTRDVVQMVLAGKVGKDLVAELGRSGVASVGIAGGDGLSFLARRVVASDGIDLGFVGEIEVTRPELLNGLITLGLVPVVACLGLGVNDWQYYNVNGDQMAATVAVACSASELVFVTDVGGVHDGNGKQIDSLDRAGILDLLESGAASGGMRPKLRACLEALDGGIARIRIVGALTDNVLPNCILENQKIGTSITHGVTRNSA
jgi:acetylglutamate kinase